MEKILYIDVKEFEKRKEFINKVLSYDIIDFKTTVSESFDLAIEEAAKSNRILYMNFDKLEFGIVKNDKQEREIINGNNFTNPEEALEIIKDKMDIKVEDKSFTIYRDRYVYLGGEIKEGCLTLDSEIDGGDLLWDSEQHIMLSKEDTKRLFYFMSLEEFIEYGKQKNLIGINDFFSKHGINPKRVTI